MKKLICAGAFASILFWAMVVFAGPATYSKYPFTKDCRIGDLSNAFVTAGYKANIQTIVGSGGDGSGVSSGGVIVHDSGVTDAQCQAVIDAYSLAPTPTQAIQAQEVTDLLSALDQGKADSVQVQRALAIALHYLRGEKF